MSEKASRSEPGEGRREAILDSAMQTFRRFGYRKTSMGDVATAARVSRPGLYFLFESKPVLFREAVTRSLNRDLDAVAEILEDRRPLPARLLAAFDRWAGSYIGPLTESTSGVDDFDPAVLGASLVTAPQRFEELVTSAIAEEFPRDAADRARTLISASTGIKHQIDSRDRYSELLEVAIRLIVGRRSQS